MVIKCGCYSCLLCVNLTTFRTLKQYWQPYSAAAWTNIHYVFLTELDNLTVLFENSSLKSPLFINKATQESWNMTPVIFYLPVNYAFIIYKNSIARVLHLLVHSVTASLLSGIIGRSNLVFSKPWCFYLQADFFLY